MTFGSFSLSGCFYAMYGPPADYEMNSSFKTVTETQEPIPGLVTKLHSESDTILTVVTNSEGEAKIKAVLDYDTEYFLTIKDIDGAENLGDFETKTIKLDTLNDEDIVMKPKK